MNKKLTIPIFLVLLFSCSKDVSINDLESKDFIENKDNFNEDEWRSLYKLSENTFVEETDSLKKGAAGAGLTDND